MSGEIAGPEIVDLTNIIDAVTLYVRLLANDGRREDDEKQRITRMLVEKRTNDWRKLYGEW